MGSLCRGNNCWHAAIRLGNHEKSWVWNDFLKNMCSKDITFVPECVLWLGLSVLYTQKLDSFGETLFFYRVANTFSQTNCQIPLPN